MLLSHISTETQVLTKSQSSDFKLVAGCFGVAFRTRLFGVRLHDAGGRLLTALRNLAYLVTTNDFIAQLRRASDKRLVFVNAEGDTIHSGYHLTEIKAAKFDTVDCGGEKNRWNETIIQLWVPADEASREFMTAGKFLSIYEKVSRMIDVDPEAEVRFEYGDENFFPSNYHVESISEIPDALHVELRPPQTTCKARDRRTAGVNCCG